MRSDMDRVIFYSKEDWSLGWELKKAVTILDKFDKTQEYTNINDTIEFYNIQQIFETGITMPEWTDTQRSNYQKTAVSLTAVIGKVFSKIEDSNFLNVIQSVKPIYFDDFWELSIRFKMIERISPTVFSKYLHLPNTTLRPLLKHEKIVRRYGTELADVMRVSKQSADILIRKYLEISSIPYFIPVELKPEEFEPILLDYVQSGTADANPLQLIYKAQSSKECPISDSLRHKAKQEYDRFWEERANTVTVIEQGVQVSFADQNEIVSSTRNGTTFVLSYDIKWFKENTDYPTVLNNFIYLFGMFDSKLRSTLVSVQSKINALERTFMVKGTKFYPQGNYFKTYAMISSAQTSLYYNFLQKIGIDLEKVFQWFFEEYLPQEFHVNGFSFYASSTSASYIERFRNLADEMDGVIKQFRMYACEGEINRELFEMSSEHIVFGSIPSLLQGKYAYANGNEVTAELNLLFSDQTMLSYLRKTEGKYPTLYETLQIEEINYEDFENYQRSLIDWLTDRQCLLKEDDGTIKLVDVKTAVLKDLYDHDVLCINRIKQWNQTIEEMIDRGDLRVENTLFSGPERDYLNFMLNKSEFSDGLDLRNRYTHGTNSRVESQHKTDYIELLKIMVLVITKINDEFCERDRRNTV